MRMHELLFRKQPVKRPHGSEHAGTGSQKIDRANIEKQRPRPPKPKDIHDTPPEQR